jgi:hypothetical protein
MHGLAGLPAWVKPGTMATLALKCSQLPSPLPQTDARIVISVENWV